MEIQVKVDRNWVAMSGKCRRFAELKLVAPKSEKESPPLSVAFVVDVSSSMRGRKIQQTIEALKQAISHLRPCDWFSITVFNHRSSVLMESLKATEEHVRFAKKLIQTIEAQGNTNISAGWSSGFHTLVEKAEQKLVIVLSDGLTNAGMVEPSQLADMTRQGIQKGVRTSTFGIGEGFDEQVLETMAHEGGGNFVFFADESRIPEIMESEIKECLAASVMNARVQVVGPPGYDGKISFLGRYKSHRTRESLDVHLGSLISKQELKLYFEFELDAIAPDDSNLFFVKVFGEDALLSEADVSFVGVSEVPEPPLLHEDVLVRSYKAKRNLVILEATHLNSLLLYDEARRAIRELARECLEAYTETLSEGLGRVHEKLILDASRFGRSMSSVERKTSHSHVLYEARSRGLFNRSSS